MTENGISRVFNFEISSQARPRPIMEYINQAAIGYSPILNISSVLCIIPPCTISGTMNE